MQKLFVFISYHFKIKSLENSETVIKHRCESKSLVGDDVELSD